MEDDQAERPDLRPFVPFLAPQEREELHGLLSFAGPTPSGFAQSLRDLARRYVDDGASLKLRAICLLVADLLDQNWRVAFEGNGLHFIAPGIDASPGQTVDDIKLR